LESRGKKRLCASPFGSEKAEKTAMSPTRYEVYVEKETDSLIFPVVADCGSKCARAWSVLQNGRVAIREADKVMKMRQEREKD
jgi:hypothetical protein